MLVVGVVIDNHNTSQRGTCCGHANACFPAQSCSHLPAYEGGGPALLARSGGCWNSRDGPGYNGLCLGESLGRVTLAMRYNAAAHTSAMPPGTPAVQGTSPSRITRASFESLNVRRNPRTPTLFPVFFRWAGPSPVLVAIHQLCSAHSPIFPSLHHHPIPSPLLRQQQPRTPPIH